MSQLGLWLILEWEKVITNTNRLGSDISQRLSLNSKSYGFNYSTIWNSAGGLLAQILRPYSPLEAPKKSESDRCSRASISLTLQRSLQFTTRDGPLLGLLGLKSCAQLQSFNPIVWAVSMPVKIALYIMQTSRIYNVLRFDLFIFFVQPFIF